MLASVKSENVDDALCCKCLPKNFLQNAIDVGKGRSIFEFWQAIASYD